jgi:hypothetical protein
VVPIPVVAAPIMTAIVISVPAEAPAANTAAVMEAAVTVGAAAMVSFAAAMEAAAAMDAAAAGKASAVRLGGGRCRN